MPSLSTTQVRIFGPRPSSNLCTDTLEQLSPEFELYSCVRSVQCMQFHFLGYISGVTPLSHIYWIHHLTVRTLQGSKLGLHAF